MRAFNRNPLTRVWFHFSVYNQFWWLNTGPDDDIHNTSMLIINCVGYVRCPFSVLITDAISTCLPEAFRICVGYGKGQMVFTSTNSSCICFSAIHIFFLFMSLYSRISLDIQVLPAHASPACMSPQGSHTLILVDVPERPNLGRL